MFVYIVKLPHEAQTLAELKKYALDKGKQFFDCEESELDVHIPFFVEGLTPDSPSQEGKGYNTANVSLKLAD